MNNNDIFFKKIIGKLDNLLEIIDIFEEKIELQDNKINSLSQKFDDVINFSHDEDDASDFDDLSKGDDGLIYSGEEAVSVDESKINDSKP
jgi:hypothetical protein